MFGASPSGKASAFGADIRWFESSRPARVKKSSEMTTFSFIFKHLNRFEDEYILKASFTASSNSLLYFSIT